MDQPTRSEVYDYLETVLSLQGDDLEPYPCNAARGEDTPRWRQSLEPCIIKPLMQGGLLVWTPRRRDWARDAVPPIRVPARTSTTSRRTAG
jgi:hypothetical protein